MTSLSVDSPSIKFGVSSHSTVQYPDYQNSKSIGTGQIRTAIRELGRNNIYKPEEDLNPQNESAASNNSSLVSWVQWDIDDIFAQK